MHQLQNLQQSNLWTKMPLIEFYKLAFFFISNKSQREVSDVQNVQKELIDGRIGLDNF